MVHWLYNVIDIIIKFTILSTSLKQFKKQSSNSTDSEQSKSSYNLEYYFNLFMTIGILAIFSIASALNSSIVLQHSCFVHFPHWFFILTTILNITYIPFIIKKYCFLKSK